MFGLQRKTPKLTVETHGPYSVFLPDGHTEVVSLHQPDKKAMPYAWALVTVDDDSFCILWDIYTRGLYRRQGKATELMRIIQSRFDRIYTHYETVNSAGYHLCLSCGFKAKPSIHKNQPNELIWEKPK